MARGDKLAHRVDGRPIPTGEPGRRVNPETGEALGVPAALAEKIGLAIAPARRAIQNSARSLPSLDRRGVVFAAVFMALTGVARSQTTTDSGRAPTLTIKRYQEDWTHLADPSRRTGHWTERFKYIPLSADGSSYLTTGMEARSRFEYYRSFNWGAAPDDSYVWHRFMPYADLHLGDLRVFIQPIVSHVSGVERPKRPVDTTGVDMLQAFAELEVNVADTASLRLSAGRKLVSLGAGRLVDTRYGPGIPQAFDIFDATLAGGSRQVTALYFRPVDVGLDDFDDRTSRQKAFWGVYATQWLAENRPPASTSFISAFAIARRSTTRVPATRWSTPSARGCSAIRAPGIGTSRAASKAGPSPVTVGSGGAWEPKSAIGSLKRPCDPELRFSADVISGDDDPNDPKLGTANPYFPRGKYFASQSPIGPRNLIHARPSVVIHPHKSVEAALSAAAYWRQSTRDGIYAISGNLVRSGADSDARFVGTQVELAVAWQATASSTCQLPSEPLTPGRLSRRQVRRRS